MNNKIIKVISLLLLPLTAIIFSGCENNQKKISEISQSANQALRQGNYKKALKDLLDLSDETLEENDSLMLLLSEAYYGLNGESVELGTHSITDMDFTKDGKHLLLTDLSGGRIVDYNFPDLTLSRVINTPEQVFAIDFSDNDSIFAAAQLDSKIAIYDFNTGKPIKTLSGHGNRVRAVLFTDSAHLISGSNDQHIITWDLLTTKPIDKQKKHSKNVKSLRKSPDGKLIVSTSNDGTAIIWDITDITQPKDSKKLVHGDNYVNDAVFSPDNNLVVTVSGDEFAKVWDVKTGKLVETLSLEDSGVSVDYSPDGKHLVIGGNDFVHLFNTENWTAEMKYPTYRDAIWGIKFLDNNNIISVDSSHIYKMNLKSKEDLIKASRQWFKDNPMKES